MIPKVGRYTAAVQSYFPQPPLGAKSFFTIGSKVSTIQQEIKCFDLVDLIDYQPWISPFLYLATIYSSRDGAQSANMSVRCGVTIRRSSGIR